MARVNSEIIDFLGFSSRIFVMDYRRLIAESWKYTQENKKLIIWLGFFPSLFTTTVGILTIAYQFLAFKKSYLFSEDDEGALHYVAGLIIDFIKANVSWTVPMVIFLAIFALFYFLLPTLAHAASIQKIARNRNGQQAGVSAGIRYGMMSFLPLFEYHLLLKSFTFFYILTEMSFVIRNLPGLWKMLFPIFLFFMILGFILTLLFTYSDFFIVIDGKGVFESMKRSAKLVIMHWKHTFLITILMIIIGIRVIVQAVFVFLVPVLILLVVGYLTTLTLSTSISVIVGGIVGLAGLITAAYLNGIIDIFAYTVWTFTFLELTSEKEMSARESFTDEIGEQKLVSVQHKNL